MRPNRTLDQQLYDRNQTTKKPIKIIGLIPEDCINSTRLTFECTQQHRWVTTIDIAITQQRGCPFCKAEDSRNKHFVNFIGKSSIIHSNKYDYSNVDYINTNTEVMIICPIHGEFFQKPIVHKRGVGCDRCARDARRLTIDNVMSRIRLVHGDRYQYIPFTNTSQTNANKITIVCEKHGEFTQILREHMNGHGCPKCVSVNASNKALTWLDYIHQQEGIQIQHAANGGEYRIPGTQLSADGYCLETNTVYEFDGDCFHGNLNVYAPDEFCHPFDKNRTAQQLYEQTRKKHDQIHQMGYNLVTIWESDFDRLGINVEKYDVVASKKDDDYPSRLLKIGLEIQGEYTGAKNHHHLKCLCCANIFFATPLSKLQTLRKYPDTYGCPDCNTRRVADKNRTRSGYKDRLLALGYEPIDYKNARTRCVLKCLYCGEILENKIPSSIVQRNRSHRCVNKNK